MRRVHVCLVGVPVMGRIDLPQEMIRHWEHFGSEVFLHTHQKYKWAYGEWKRLCQLAGIDFPRIPFPDRDAVQFFYDALHDIRFLRRLLKSMPLPESFRHLRSPGLELVCYLNNGEKTDTSYRHRRDDRFGNGG